MTFDPNNPPQGFPSDGLQTINRKPYITHIGLVWLQNQGGKPWSSTIDDLKINYDDQGFPVCAVVVATVTDGESSHTAVGDCSTQSTNAKIAPHLIRMAGTRAKNRGLRLLVGYAGTTAEEIPLESTNGSGRGPAPPQDQKREEPPPRDDERQPEPEAQTSGDNGIPSCPSCRGGMWDNTEDRKRQQEEYASGARTKKPGPAYRCRSKSCDGVVWNASQETDLPF